MRPSELGPLFESNVRRIGGDPTAPTAQQAYDAFRSTLDEPFEDGTGGARKHEDVLLFEVGELLSASTGDATGFHVNLDRRIFYGDTGAPETLSIEWHYGLDDVLTGLSDTQIMGRGPGLAAGEGMTTLEAFLAAVEKSPVFARMRELTPTRIRTSMTTP